MHLQATALEKSMLQQQVLILQKDLRELQTQHSQEMSHVEVRNSLLPQALCHSNLLWHPYSEDLCPHMQARVKGALLRKEETLNAALAREAALASQLHSTEAALAQHQAELQRL